MNELVNEYWRAYHDDRTNGANGQLHEAVQEPEPQTKWHRARAWLLSSSWGRYLMVTKQEGRYSVSQPLALAVLGFILIFGGTWYWRSTDKMQEQHDEIIRLQTRLESEKEKNIDQDSKIDQARNYATVADKNQARLEGKFDQFALTYAISNPKPRTRTE